MHRASVCKQVRLLHGPAVALQQLRRRQRVLVAFEIVNTCWVHFLTQSGKLDTMGAPLVAVKSDKTFCAQSASTRPFMVVGGRVFAFGELDELATV